jgi:single-strand DNA-binding protein
MKKFDANNLVLVRGTLSSAPVRRTLPNGSDIVQIEVTSRDEGGAARSVPVIVHEPIGKDDFTTWDAGTEVVVVGAVVRRFFRSGGGTASRTEVVAARVVRGSQAARVERLLAEVAKVVAAEVAA